MLMKKANRHFRILLLMIITIGFSYSANAQWGPNNYLTLTTLTPWNFIINTPAKLESTQVITNAFKLQVKSSASNCTVYAKVTNGYTPSGFIPTSSPLYVDFNYTTCPSSKYSNLTATPINLFLTDVKLFNQSLSSTVYEYYYHLRLGPLGYDYPPGAYSFTITFTMTQP